MNGLRPTAARLAMKQLEILVVLLVLSLAPALAQVNSGFMSGTVSDTSGAIIPNAKVTATEAKTGTSYNTVANSAGIYTLPSLLPGTYNFTVTAPSFKAAELISDIGTSISEQQVDDLPIAAGSALRSLSTLTFLTPGAVGAGTNGGTEYAKIGGGQTFGSDNVIDGLSTLRSENGTGFFDLMTPSVDAIGESGRRRWLCRHTSAAPRAASPAIRPSPAPTTWRTRNSCQKRLRYNP